MKEQEYNVYSKRWSNRDKSREKHFDILPIDKITDIENKSEYKKLEITSSQKIQMGGFVQQIPAVLAAKTLAEAYILKFPKWDIGCLSVNAIP